MAVAGVLALGRDHEHDPVPRSAAWAMTPAVASASSSGWAWNMTSVRGIVAILAAADAVLVARVT